MPPLAHFTPGARMRAIVSVVLAAPLVFIVRHVTIRQDQRPQWPEPPHSVLLVGTFHFSNAGLDSYRPQFDVDILSPDRQAQVVQLVRQLATYRPTKVAVEAMPDQQARLDSLYERYRNGQHQLGSNEIFQVGFRLAHALGLPRVHAVDAERRFYEPWVDPDSFARARGQQNLLDPDLVAQYQRLARWEDAAKVRQPLGDYLLYLNEPQRLLRSHGQYLIGNFEVGDSVTYPGVDSKTAWYNRNLRIFANLQRLVASRNERIILIIGAGHVPLLRHCVESSPQFRLVELADVLSPRR
jgi:hypothetical protein